MMKKSEQIKKAIIERWIPIYFDNAMLEETRCYLCEIYKTWKNAFYCDKCPVFFYTKETNCGNTPYEKYYLHRNRDNAREELLFLIKLFKHYKRLEIKK